MNKRLNLILVLVSLVADAGAQTTTRISVDSNGVQANGDCGTCWMSAGGAAVAFTSAASNLVAGDMNNAMDVFVRDLVLSTTTRVSLASGGVQLGGDSLSPSISADGRYVAFENLGHVFVHDRLSGTTVQADVDSGGTPHGGGAPILSADGRFVAFTSDAPGFVAGDTNGVIDAFLHDLVGGSTMRVSVSAAGAQASQGGGATGISAQGRYVVFSSWTDGLVTGDTNGMSDVFVRDTVAGTTSAVSLSTAGQFGNGSCTGGSVSVDGRYATFESNSSSLVAGDTNGVWDLFVRDLVLGRTTRVSVTSGGGEGTQALAVGHSMSSDGRFMGFISRSSLASETFPPADWDVFLHDRSVGRTTRESLAAGGEEGNDQSWLSVGQCVGLMSDDGRYVAFVSAATNLVPGDTNDFIDVFVRDTGAVTGAGFCSPGDGTVTALCPCANAPGFAGRGCDNSARGGGGGIIARGTPSISAPTLSIIGAGMGVGNVSCTVLSQTTVCVLLQSNVQLPAGVVFNEGVRCLGGAIKRIQAGTTILGGFASSVNIPNQSANQGDSIVSGQERYYALWYRDPCPSWFGGVCAPAILSNVSSTWRITWGP